MIPERDRALILRLADEYAIRRAQAVHAFSEAEDAGVMIEALNIRKVLEEYLAMVPTPDPGPLLVRPMLVRES